MSSNVVNTMPYLRTSREYPQDDVHLLSVELSRTYIDVALAINDRSIGIFPTKRSAITGNNYFFTTQRQESQRQVYTFSSFGNIAHGINLNRIYGFIHIYGTFTDGTVWYPIPYVNQVNANNQVSIVVNATNIVITAGAGTPPSVTQGFVVLEWILKP